MWPKLPAYPSPLASQLLGNHKSQHKAVVTMHRKMLERTWRREKKHSGMHTEIRTTSSPVYAHIKAKWQVALSKFSGSQSPPRDPAGAPVASVYQSISDELYLGQPGPDAILPADLLGCWERCSTLSGFHSQPSVICQDMACRAVNLCVCACMRLTLSSVSNGS